MLQYIYLFVLNEPLSTTLQASQANAMARARAKLFWAAIRAAVRQTKRWLLYQDQHGHGHSASATATTPTNVRRAVNTVVATPSPSSMSPTSTATAEVDPDVDSLASPKSTKNSPNHNVTSPGNRSEATATSSIASLTSSAVTSPSLSLASTPLGPSASQQERQKFLGQQIIREGELNSLESTMGHYETTRDYFTRRLRLNLHKSVGAGAGFGPMSGSRGRSVCVFCLFVCLFVFVKS